MSLEDKLAKYYGLDSEKSNNPNPPHMPQKPFRWIVAGQSGCGKTSKIFEHIIKGELKFDKIYIYARNLFQQKYRLLCMYYADLAEKMGVPLESIIEVGTEPEDIKAPDEMDPDIEKLVIFDDYIADKKLNDTVITDHFIRGRHSNCSYVYITQTFFAVPKTIRLQASDNTVFHTSNEQEINAIYKRAGTDMPKEVFLQKFKEETGKPFGSFTFSDG